MMKKIVQESLISLIALLLLLTMFFIPASAEEGTQPAEGGEKAKRTILLYDCGSDLETEAGLASFNLRQILGANFSKNDDIRFIVMTGGADKWHLEKENLVFPEDVSVPEDAVSLLNEEHPLDPRDPDSYDPDQKSQISNTYNQIWEAKGLDAVDNAGKLVLVDGDGVMGDGAGARRSIVEDSAYTYDEDGYRSFDESKEENYEWMSDPEVLKAFINYGVENYPAEKYDLILWDHGAGPQGGFCSDLHDSTHGWSLMPMDDLYDALSKNKVVDADGNGEPDGRFDFINFDACLMNCVEVDLMLSDLTDYYVASPETEPGYGQDYKGWLDLAGQNPDINTYELGKKMVDDFVAFYDKESGPGASQDGTLAVIDMRKLMEKKIKTSGSDQERGFLEALSELNQHMQNEVVLEGLYYDEFRSFKSSLSYGELEYYDLGNLVSQLAYVFDEADYENLQDGGINNHNAYSDTAEVLLKILDDPTIIYARGTKRIHTKDQFYRNADGEIARGEQGTSGIYISFAPLQAPGSPLMYQWIMERVIQKMDPDDPRARYLKDLNQTMTQYGLVYHTGTAVTDMVSSGTAKDTIDYDAVKEYWRTHTDKSGMELWEDIQLYTEAVEGGEAEAKKWLEPIIRQQRDEAVLKNQIQTQPFKAANGTGCMITLNNVKKQAIDGVTMNVIAELPAVKSFLQNPDHAKYAEDFQELPTDLIIGTIDGKEVFDIDMTKQGYEKAIDWLFEPKSKWKLDPPEDKWYALQDADGKIHVAAPSVYENEIIIPAGYFTKELRENFEGEMELTDVCHPVKLLFEKDGAGKWNLTEMYFELENGSGRYIPVSEYKGNLDLFTMVAVSDGWSSNYLPASKTTFNLSPETVSKISVNYVSAKTIPDIEDTDNDGRKLHSAITVNNIYGQKVDITDLVNKVSVKTNKKANTLAIKGRKAKVKYKKLKKKAQALKVSKVIKFVNKGQGKKTYKLLAAKKGKKSYKKYFKINKKNGKVTVKKGLKKGTYRVKVKVKAAGNANYKAVARKVIFKIKVK